MALATPFTATPLALAVEQDAPPQSGLVADTEPAPDGVSIIERVGTPAEDSSVPLSTHQALWELEHEGVGALVNTYEWDSSTETLIAYSATPGEVRTALDKALPNEQKFRVQPAANSKEEVRGAQAKLLSDGGRVGSDSRVTYAYPSKDGSQITVGVAGLEESSALPPQAADHVEDILESRLTGSGVHLVVEPARQDWSAAIRTIPSSYGSFVAGGGMRSTNGYGCTMGFRMGNLTTGSSGMLSAHHCGDGAGVNTSWYNRESFADVNYLGGYRAQQSVTSAAGVGSDLGRWTGSGISKLRAYISIGAYDDISVSSWTPVKGGVVPVVGDRVCYSGAYSGKVCSNVVDVTNFGVCYLGDSLCYAGLSLTYSETLVPSVGDGDSGGPVYVTMNGKAYAAGVVSGYGPPAPDCNGEPASSGRSCSVWALFAPIVYGLNSTTGWGLSYVPD